MQRVPLSLGDPYHPNPPAVLGHLLMPPPHSPHPSTVSPTLTRSWVNLYCVLSKGDLGFYKDAKGQATGSTHGGEPLLNLHHSTSEVANDYKKKKNVFKLKYVRVVVGWGGPPKFLGLVGWRCWVGVVE